MHKPRATNTSFNTERTSSSNTSPNTTVDSKEELVDVATQRTSSSNTSLNTTVDNAEELVDAATQCTSSSNNSSPNTTVDNTEELVDAASVDSEEGLEELEAELTAVLGVLEELKITLNNI